MQVVQAAMSRFLQTASDKDKEVFGRLFKDVGESVPAQLETKVRSNNTEDEPLTKAQTRTILMDARVKTPAYISAWSGPM